MKTILITGATGFVGRGLIKQLLECDVKLYAAVRQESPFLAQSIQQLEVGDLSADTDWTKALSGIDVVIHFAAQVHVMDKATSSLVNFHSINTEGTLNLARQAVKASVRRFIFLSSIKVNGETTRIDKPFVEDDINIPIDPYALSKYETEQGLNKLSKQTGIEIVIIRPPLVYGSGVKGNLLTMMSWLDKGLPLPLGRIHNKRSLVALDNLVSLIVVCINHPSAVNQVFLVSDGQDLSTTELLALIANSLNKSTYLLPIPEKILSNTLKLLGKNSIASRLCNSLQVDISKSKELLGWSPKHSVSIEIQGMVNVYLENKSHDNNN